jgi:PAS domain S-box-containing protein/putative nucleotidyltransferase with HDIG domain
LFDELLTQVDKSMYEKKTKEQLMDELKELRQRIAGLEKSEAERKRIEEAQKKEKAFTENALNTLQDVFFVFDLDGRLSIWNKAMSEVTGYSDAEISSMQPPDFFSGEDIQRVVETIGMVVKEGRASIEATAITKDGRHIPYEFTGAILKDQEGRPIGICGIGRDITNRKKAEKELSETKQFLENIVDGIADEILLISKDFKILWANKAFLNRTGYKIEEILGDYCYKVTHNFEVPCQPPHCLCPIDEMQKSGEPVTLQHIHLNKKGDSFFVEVTAYPIKDEKGEIVQFISLSRDVTERKKKEDEIQRRTRELSILNTVSQAASRFLNLEALQQEILQTIRTTLNVDAGGLALVDKVTKMVVPSSYFGFSKEAMDILAPTQKVGEPIIGLVVSSGEAIVVEDLIGEATRISQEVKDLVEKEGLKASVFLPIKSKNRIIGVLVVARKSDLKFTPNEVELLNSISNQISVAIENARLYEEIKRSEESLRVSHRFLEVANKFRDMNTMLKEFVAEVLNFTDCSAIGIRLLDEKGNIPYQVYEGFSQRFYESESPLSIKSDQCMCINVIKGTTDPELPFYTEGGSFYINGTTRFLATVSEEEKKQTRNVCNQFGYESVALIPIRLEDRIIGLIHVADPRENMVPLHKVQVLEKVSIQIGTAIGRVKAEEDMLITQFSVDKAAEGVAWIGKDGRFLYVNNAVCRYLGYSCEELLSMSVKDIDPDMSEDVWQNRWEEMKQKEALTSETCHRAKDGRLIPVRITANYIKYEDKEFHIAFIRDISERKQAEKVLRETRDYLENLINYANAPIIVWNPALGITRFNHAFEHLTGYTADEVIGQNLSILFPEESRNESLRRIEQSASGEYWKSVEIPILRKDGDIRIALWNSANIYLEDGTLLATIAQGTNYTDRKLAEEALRESEKKYRDLVENALVGVYKTNLKGDILYANEAMVKIFEFESPEEFMSGSVLARYKNPKDREVLIENLKKEGTVENFETEVVTKTGKVRHIFLSATLDRDTISGMVKDITELKHTQEKLQRQLDHISALRTIDLAITASLDLRVTFNIFLDQVTTQLKVDAADILLFDSNIQKLEFVAGRGFKTSALKCTRLSLGEGNAGRAAIERRIIHISNLREGKDSFKRAPLLDEEGFVAYYGVPLIAKGHVRGVLEIFHRSPLEPDPNWLDFLESLARQAAVAIDNASLFDSLQRSNIELLQSYDTTLEGWSRALDLRDKETEGHSVRVTEITLRIARALGMVNSELIHIRRGALLHDIGKMGIPDRILLKPGPLTDEEREIMQEHPVYSYELLSPIAFLRPALDIPYYHHEKWDGTGYPRGLKGEQIPLSARIFALVDVYDALNSDRPYRPAWAEEEVKKYIQDQVGKHFDPKVVEEFFKMKWQSLEEV